MMPNNAKSKKNSKLAASTKNLLRSLNLIVADNEEKLYAKAKHAGEDEALAKSRIQDQLKAVKEILLSAESPVQVNSQHPARYVHPNQWRLVGIAACANLIVAMQNVKH